MQNLSNLLLLLRISKDSTLEKKKKEEEKFRKEIGSIDRLNRDVSGMVNPETSAALSVGSWRDRNGEGSNGMRFEPLPPLFEGTGWDRASGGRATGRKTEGEKGESSSPRENDSG